MQRTRDRPKHSTKNIEGGRMDKKSVPGRHIRRDNDEKKVSSIQKDTNADYKN